MLLFSRDIEKATSNFTTIIGHGAFGSVYKAVMATGETVAVKVLGTDSSQGEQEFLTEVISMLMFLLVQFIFSQTESKKLENISTIYILSNFAFPLSGPITWKITS